MQEFESGVPEKSLADDEYFEYLRQCLDDKAEKTNDFETKQEDM